MNILAELFLTFAKIGCFTFGGGYAMISLIEENCVEKKQWITHDDMMNITVIAESTPGPIAINCATFVGYRQAGLSGATAATIGMIVPSFLIIFTISQFLEHFLEIRWVAGAFGGIKLAVGILIANAAVNMLQKMKKKPFPMITVTAAFAVMLLGSLFSVHISSIVLMLAAGAVSLALFTFSSGEKGGQGAQSGTARKGGASK